MKSILVTFTFFLSIQSISSAFATPVKLLPFKQYAAKCNPITVEGNLNLRTRGAKITIQTSLMTESFTLKACERFYDSLLCDYLTVNGNKVLTDDFCYDNGETIVGCLVYNECYYQI